MAVFLLHQLLLQRASTHLEGTGFPLENMPFKSIKNYFHELRLFTCKPVIQMMCAFTLAHRDLSMCSSFFWIISFRFPHSVWAREEGEGTKRHFISSTRWKQKWEEHNEDGAGLSLTSWNEYDLNTARHPDHTPAQKKLGEAQQSFELS